MSGRFNWQSSVMYFLVVFLVGAQLIHIEGCFEKDEPIGTIESEIIQSENNDDSVTSFYRAIQDSMDNIDAIKRTRTGNTGTSMVVGAVGVSQLNDYFFTTGNEKITTTHYYFVLDNYRISPHTKFVIKDSHYYLKSVVWDSVRNGRRMGHYETRQIPIRYENGGTGTTAVYFPVNKSLYRAAQITLIAGFAVLAICSIYFLFLLPAKILLRISKAHFFHKKNIPELRAVAFYLIGLWFLNSVLPVIVHWIFARIIPQEIYLNHIEALFDWKFLLVGGLILLIVARAFERGYEMEKEIAASVRNLDR